MFDHFWKIMVHSFVLLVACTSKLNRFRPLEVRDSSFCLPNSIWKWATMHCSPRTLVLLGLWIFLISWTYLAMIRKYLHEDTIFSHYEKENGFHWPVMNICPMYLFERNNSSTTFEEMEVEIENSMMSFSNVSLLVKGAKIDNQK